jgi:hypothetical protein
VFLSRRLGPRVLIGHCAGGCCNSIKNYDAEKIVNLGLRQDLTIRAAAEMVMSVIGYSDSLVLPSPTVRLLSFSLLHD